MTIYVEELSLALVEVPHTGTSALRAMLMDEFGRRDDSDPARSGPRGAGSHRREEPEGRHVVGGSRHPLDVLVTWFFKQKNDHNGFYTEDRFHEDEGGHMNSARANIARQVREEDLSFSEYLLRFHKYPYDQWGSPRPDQFDFTYRFESLAADTDRLLVKHLGLTSAPTLPVVNTTQNRGKDFTEYYDSDAARKRGAQVTRPFAKIWGYDMPAGFPKAGPTDLAIDAAFRAMQPIRKFRHRHKETTHNVG